MFHFFLSMCLCLFLFVRLSVRLYGAINKDVMISFNNLLHNFALKPTRKALARHCSSVALCNLATLRRHNDKEDDDGDTLLDARQAD